ncbi:5243_t:CDS:1, partial [Diversispora eburnea]
GKSPKLYYNHHADCVEGELFVERFLGYVTNINDNLIIGNRNDHSIVYNKPKIYCACNNVPQLSHASRNCNWFVEDERIVEEKGGFIISRQELMREILICPHLGKYHNNHKTNRELVTNKRFWAWVLDQAVNVFLKNLCNDPYPVEGFTMNFGKWESAMECHGHLHLQLTQNVVMKMENKYDAMRGKLNNPTNYGFQELCGVGNGMVSRFGVNNYSK